MAQLPEIVNGESVELGAFSLEHVDAGYAAASESRSEIQQWLGWAQEPFTHASYEEFVREQSGHFADDVGWRYFIFEPVTKQLLGGCSVELVDVSRANVGYWIRTSRTGHDLATRAARLLTSVTFAFLTDVQVVEMSMDVANAASARVPEKLGFSLLGDFDKRVRALGHTGRGLIWTMTRDDWKNEVFGFVMARQYDKPE